MMHKDAVCRHCKQMMHKNVVCRHCKLSRNHLLINIYDTSNFYYG